MVAARGEAAAALRRLFGPTMRPLSPRLVTTAVSHGGFCGCCSGRLFYTSRVL